MSVFMPSLEKIEIKTSKAPRLPGPLPQGIRAGNLLFVPCGPLTLDGRIIEGNFEVAVRQMMENTKIILESAGSSMEKIVRVDVYLQKMENVDTFNKVYKEYIKEPYPARSLCQPERTPSDTPCGMIVTAIVD
jgi:2-iminobutanoate/2-iminopropanoate deaminase